MQPFQYETIAYWKGQTKLIQYFFTNLATHFNFKIILFVISMETIETYNHLKVESVSRVYLKTATFLTQKHQLFQELFFLKSTQPEIDL